MFHKLQNRGFTLIELLTVMLIIGILGSVAIPQYTRSVRRAEMTEGLTHGKTILDSAARYKALNGEAPTNFNQLDVNFVGVNLEEDVFDDGNFKYQLYGDKDYISAFSTKGDYELRFQYPTENEYGVFAAIQCCPGNSKNAQWVCKNASTSKLVTTDEEGCNEI